MIFQPLHLEGAYCVTLEPRQDTRGLFARTYCADEFSAEGLNTHWVQMNTSVTREAGSLRGLHFQRGASAEVKLVRCVHGAVFDVMVDLRQGASTYGQVAVLELSAQNGQMAYIPEGFGHGFQALEQDATLVYMHSQFYDPGNEGGLLATDPTLGIDWPLPPSGLSERDSSFPLLRDLEPLT